MINKKTMELLRKSKKTKAKLQLALDKSAATIQRYIDSNDIMLTTAIAVTAIANGLNIPKSKVLCDCKGSCTLCRNDKQAAEYAQEKFADLHSECQNED